MSTTRRWLSESRAWLDTDLRLMTTPAGWARRARKGGVEIDARRMPDDPNDLFRWEIARLGAAHEVVFDMDGWSPFVLHTFHLRGHPQETTENCVDFGHFTWVHGYEAVRMLDAPLVDGPYLGLRYAFIRPLLHLAGRTVGVREHIRVHVHGLGYSMVEVEDRTFGAEARLLVLPVPVDDLRVGVSARDPACAGHLPRALRSLSRRVAPALVLRVLRHEVTQDFAIWTHKRYLEAPALASGDGPIGLYRRWARQFYEGASVEPSASVRELSGRPPAPRQLAVVRG